MGCSAGYCTIAWMALLLCFSVCWECTDVTTTEICRLDKSETQAKLEMCVQGLQDFISDWLRSVRKGGRTPFDTCTEFISTYRCVQPLTAHCPRTHPRLQDDWLHVYDIFKCACNGSEVCAERIHCYEDQHGGLLGRHCDAWYKFNVRLKTRDRCWFTSKNVHCKQALVASSCGKEAGKFAFHVSKLADHKHTKRCDVQPSDHFEEFHFSQKCPVDFIVHLDDCQEQYLDRNMLFFYEENDLVAEGKRKDVKRACRDLSSYERCVQPIRESCPEGTEILFSFDGPLRTYLLKMKYLCEKAKEDYISNMACYQEVLQNKTLQQCSHIYLELQPLRESVNAFKFYCEPEQKGSRDLQQQLNHLKDCYSNLYNSACGKTAAVTMSGLISTAFEDPFYLRFKYKPNCDDHLTTQSPVTVVETHKESNKELPVFSKDKADTSYKTVDNLESTSASPGLLFPWTGCLATALGVSLFVAR